MATFKIMPAIASFAAVNYNEEKQKKEKGQRIHLENFAWLQGKENITETDIKNFLEKWSSFNSRVKNKQFHAVISAKGRSEDFAALKDKALKIMQQLGYENNPILMYSHNDTKNNHVHIVTSRVDQHGHKINDSFEKMRAMEALSQVEELKIGRDYDKHVKGYLAYNFDNTNQFNLLMEKQGYKPRAGNEVIDYWKYNELQGSLDSATIKQRIAQVDKEQLNARAKQLKAIIIKYQSSYSTELKNDKALYSDGKNMFSSKLTQYLGKKHGLEFVFFSKDTANTPYGYMIIDHANKNVFKGSDVLKLSELLNPDRQLRQKVSDCKPERGQNSDNYSSRSGDDKMTNNMDIGSAVHEVVKESMKDNDQGKQGTRSTDDLPARKRKKRNQR